MEASVNLTFLCQLISAGDVITFEFVEKFGILTFLVTAFDHLMVLPLMLLFAAWILFSVRDIWASVLRYFFLLVMANSLMLYLSLLMTSEVPIVRSLGMLRKTLLSELLDIIKGSALLCNVVLLTGVV